MPVNYLIGNGYVELILRGNFTDEELENAQNAAIADPAFKAPMKLLVNALESTATPSSETVHQRVGLYLSFKDKFAPYAVFLSRRGSLEFGLSRMFSAMIEEEGVKIDVFSDREQALKALFEYDS